MIVLALVVFFPVGLVLLWTTSPWSRRTRWVTTAIVTIAVITLGTTAPSNKHHPTPVAAAVANNSPTTLATHTSAPTFAAPTPAASNVEPTPTVTPTLSPATVHAAPSTTDVTSPRAAVTSTRHVTPTQPATRPASSHTSTRPATVNLCGAPPNPMGYNFCGGNLITNPAPQTCNYFDCIANFPNGVGYMVECNDHTYSMSGGRSGACSDHHGEDQPVYS